MKKDQLILVSENRLRELLRVEMATMRLFERIKHGDEEHQEWLRTEIYKHFELAYKEPEGT